jgi:hypothetical protein
MCESVVVVDIASTIKGWYVANVVLLQLRIKIAFLLHAWFIYPPIVLDKNLFLIDDIISEKRSSSPAERRSR